MLNLLIFGTASLVAIIVLLCGILLAATGNVHWNAAISRGAKNMWLAGFALALVISILWLGPGRMISTWPYWATALFATGLIFGVLDIATGRSTHNT